MGHSTPGASDRAAGASLVGRDAELRAARAALGEGAGVVVCAAPGCGASALAAAIAPEPALRIVATPAGRSIPRWAVRAALDAAGSAPADDAVALVDQLAAHLAAPRGAGRARPPIVLVEQVDDLDDESTAVVVELVASGRARIVATRHRTRPAPPAVAALWRDAGAVRLDLDPLADDPAAELVRDLLGGDVDGRTTSDLVALASGAPGILVAVVGWARTQGTLRREGGLWRLTAEPSLPPDLAERADAELAELTPEERRALELLAVSGPLPVELADAACGAAALEGVERRRLVEVDAEGRVRHAGPLLARHLEAELRPLARRRVDEQLAEAADAVGATDREDELGLRAVVWHVDAGRPLPADRLLRAAHQAIDHLDAALGERLAAASAAAAPTAAAVLLQAWCADQQGRTDRGRAILEGYEPEDDEADVALAIRRAEQAFWHQRDATRARELLRTAGARLPSPWNLATAAQLHVFDVLEGAIPDALAGAGPLADHEEPLVGSTAALALSLAQMVDDRPGEARATAEAALARLDGPTPTLYIDPGVHVIALGLALHGLGELQAADELTAAVYRHAIGRPGLQAQGWSALLHSIVLTALGRPSDAVAVALEAEHIWASADVEGLAAWCAAAAALAAAERADLDTVTAALERIDRRTTAPFTLYDPWVDRARAWQAELGGDRADALVRLRQAGADARDAGRPSLAAAVAHDLVRLDAPADAAELLRGLDRSSPLTLLRLRLAEATAAGDAPRLVAVAGAFRDGGADGWAAEADALAALAAPARAAAVRPSIAALAARTGLATPPIARLLDTEEQQGLTRREEQIVALAAEGLSNRAIADTLVVSVRTVENHLHRAFAKLGVASRSELLARSTG